MHYCTNCRPLHVHGSAHIARAAYLCMRSGLHMQYRTFWRHGLHTLLRLHTCVCAKVYPCSSTHVADLVCTHCSGCIPVHVLGSTHAVPQMLQAWSALTAWAAYLCMCSCLHMQFRACGRPGLHRLLVLHTCACAQVYTCSTTHVADLVCTRCSGCIPVQVPQSIHAVLHILQTWSVHTAQVAYLCMRLEQYVQTMCTLRAVCVPVTGGIYHTC